MGKRPGRKRDKKPTKVALVAIEEEPRVDKTAFFKGVEVRDRVVDGKAVTLVSRETALEVTLRREQAEDRKRLAMAAEELVKLYYLCRKYASDAPSINPKAASLQPSYGHEPEQTEGVISFGRKVHERYQGGIRAMNQDRMMISATLAVCLENKVATRELAVKGLEILADFYGF